MTHAYLMLAGWLLGAGAVAGQGSRRQAHPAAGHAAGAEEDAMKCPRRVEGPFLINDGDDSWSARGTCSYCGSMEPGRFMELAEGGALLGPTDKNYKVYVGERDKFYFQHLDDAQRIQFIELMNSGKLKLDYPGRFYVLPFFASRK